MLLDEHRVLVSRVQNFVRVGYLFTGNDPEGVKKSRSISLIVTKGIGRNPLAEERTEKQRKKVPSNVILNVA